MRLSATEIRLELKAQLTGPAITGKPPATDESLFNITPPMYIVASQQAVAGGG